MPQNNSQARLNAAAKEAGFPSYAAWKAWQAKYRGPATNQAKSTAPAKPPARNFLQTLVNKVPSQFSLIKSASDELGKANQRTGNKSNGRRP